jgi:hypothetical protein
MKTITGIKNKQAYMYQHTHLAESPYIYVITMNILQKIQAKAEVVAHGNFFNRKDVKSCADELSTIIY